jgi:putative addiction module killer protein
MIELRKTREFDRWLSRLKDRQARAKIDIRLRHLSAGHAGDQKAVGDGVHELRVHCGPGYRVYFTRRGTALVIILAGGDKSSQVKDIRLAQQLSREL